MNSEQEKIAAELSAKSLGAPFLFVPDAHRAGKTLVAPCDLVWVCNGGIILFRFAESGRSRDKMSRHNFNALKSGFREWRLGRRLKGKNRYASFGIPFDQYPHKALVSVVKGPEAASEWNGEVSRELAAEGCPPTLCATIPLNVLEYIAAHGGSATDLLQYLSRLSGPASEPGMTEAPSLRAVRRQHNAAYNFAPPGEFIDFRTDPRLLAVDPVCRTLRSPASQEGLVPFLLADLGWSQALRLVHPIRQMERKTLGLPPGLLGIRAAGIVLDLSPYLVGLIVSRSGSAGDATGQQDALIQREIGDHPRFRERFSVLLRYRIGSSDQRSVSASVIPCDDDLAPVLQSQSAALLDSIRARTAPPDTA